MRRTVAVVLLAAGLVLAACGEDGVSSGLLEEDAGKVAGDYQIIAARSPDGATYTGSMNVAARGPYYKLLWELPGRPSLSGVGIRSGPIFGVGWSNGVGYGVMVYKVLGERLAGRWVAFNSYDKLGTEDIVGPATLNGSFKIDKAIDPASGQPYTGTVTIEPKGETFQLTWKLSNGSNLKGVGLRVGDDLVVGFSSSGKGGVSVYQVMGKELQGRWVEIGSTAVGQENVKR
jgi:hypothetical protein